MKLLGGILIGIGALLLFFSIIMSFFCNNKNEYVKFATKFYRWVFIIGGSLTMMGIIVSQL